MVAGGLFFNTIVTVFHGAAWCYSVKENTFKYSQKPSVHLSLLTLQPCNSLSQVLVTGETLEVNFKGWFELKV